MMGRLPVLGLAVLLLLGGAAAMLEREQLVLGDLLIGAGLVVAGAWLAAEVWKTFTDDREDPDG